MRMSLGKFLRPSALALVLGLVPLAPALAQMVLHMPSAAQSPALQQRALGLAVGESLRLESLSLDDTKGNTAAAELRRIAVLDAKTRFIEHTGEQTRDIEAPVRAHFSGQIAGEPDSSVFVSIDGEGTMRSIIERGGEMFVTEVAPGSAQRPARAASRRVEQQSDFANRPFSCGVTPQFIAENNPPVDAAQRQTLSHLARASQPSRAGASAAQRRADLIIETDHELFQRFGSSSLAAAYIADLFGYINTRYQSEIGTRLNLTQVNIYATPADPWTRSNKLDQLDDLQAYWNAPSRATQQRHHVHLLSAKNGGGGVAYMNTLDSPAYSYGVSTGVEGNFSAASPQLVWDAIQVAHEIGHAFGSDHTHNFDAPYIGSAQGGAIDCCYADSTNSQCGARNGGAGRPGALPGISSLTGGQSGQGTGTLMSYCHQVGGGYPNLSFSFGTNHPYGINPGRVVDVMRDSASSLPLDNVQPPATYLLSVARSGTGSGSVSSSPSGIQCGSDCSETYAKGTAVAITAAPAAGSTFTGWSGACSGTASSCTVNMTSALSVTANFTVATATRLLTLSKSGTGAGTVNSTPVGFTCLADCGVASASFPSNTAITLTAHAVTGSQFAGWSGACSGTSINCTLAAGTSALNVTATFNTSSGGGGTLTDPTLFVAQQYRDLFNRSPDAASLNYWAGQLKTGVISQAQLIESFMAQADFKDRYGPLVRLYTAYFRRIPDYGGLMYWYGELYPANGGNGRLFNHVSDSFAQSAEFVGTYGNLNNLQFVELVYQNVLGRTAEPAGRDYWVGRLNAGLIRGEMMIGFSESAENVSINRHANSITMAYAGMLRRAPTTAEHAQWLADLKAGRATAVSLIAVLLKSAEYASRF